MKINPVISFLKPVSINYNNCSSPIKFKGLNKDIFEKSENKTRFTPKSQPFEGDKSYLQMPAEEMNAELKNVDILTKEAALDNVSLGTIMKNVLDEKYGEDSWVFVSVGRSPAGIAKVLEYLGEDVRYMPISNLMSAKEMVQKHSPSTVKEKIHPSYIEYLKSIGLTKERIEQDDRKFIFCDYTRSGASLQTVKNAVERVFDIDKNKVDFISMNDELENYIQKNGTSYESELLEGYIHNYLAHSGIETYTDVPYLEYFNLDKTEEREKRGKTKEVQDFELAVCCILKMQGKI